MGKTTYYVKEQVVLDQQTGEVASIETVKKHKIKIDADKFYMTFIEYMAPVFGLKNGTAKSVLEWMCRNAIFNTGKVSLSASDRQDICKLLGISPQTLTNCLTLLKEKKLIDGDKGSYTINPNIYWKGDLKSRNAILNTEEIQVAFTVSIPDVKIQDSNDAIWKEVITNGTEFDLKAED